jgi:hypothetical protein
LIKQGIQSRVVREISKIGDTEGGGSANFDITATTTRSGSSNESVNVATGGAVTETKTSSGTVGATETYTAGN